MRTIFTILAPALVLLSSCSSVNKTRQTPDDVYYSPGAPKQAYATKSSGNQDEYYSTAPSDRYVRMKSVDPVRWSYFDDYNYYDSYYAPMGVPYYGYGYPTGGYYGYSSLSLGMGLWNPYFGWNNYFLWNSYYNPYFYNPYYGGAVVILNPKVSSPVVYSHLSSFNPATYRSGPGFVNGINGTNNRYYRPGTAPSTYYNNPGRNSGSRYNNTNSNSYRPVFNNGASRSFSSPAPARSYSPPSGGGGGGGFSRPGRH